MQTQRPSRDGWIGPQPSAYALTGQVLGSSVCRGSVACLLQVSLNPAMPRLLNMKTKRSRKPAKIDPIEKRRDWQTLRGRAMMRVLVSGGPIQAPHEPVIQLLIRPWMGGDESWTVYRHATDPQQAGKAVSKKWYREADRERFRSLGWKHAPHGWLENPSVTESQVEVPAEWVRALERKIERLSIPPITGRIRPLVCATGYRLSLWRSRQKSQFSWRPTAPAGWNPLFTLFSSLLRSLRRHADGKPLASVESL